MKVLYTHIEKCGGTWIREMFKQGGWTIYVDDRLFHEGNSNILNINQNMQITDYSEWDTHLIVLRDPWLRLCSYYNYSVASAWENGSEKTQHPSVRVFMENINLDRDYGDNNRHTKLPKYFPDGMMPFRTMKYTLDLLNPLGLDIRDEECVFDLGSEELHHWLNKLLNLETEIFEPINTSSSLMKKHGVEEHYREDLTAVEKAGVLMMGSIDDDLELWDRFTKD